MARATKAIETVEEVTAVARVILTEGALDDGGVSSAQQLIVGTGLMTLAHAEAAGELLRASRTRRKLVVAHYKPIKAAVKKSLGEIAKLEKEDLAPCALVDSLLEEPLKQWLVSARVAADVANKAALVEAEKTARETQARQAEALRSAATVATTRQEARALEVQARQVERATPLPRLTTVVEAPKIAGISSPTRKTGEVIDVKLLMQAVLKGKVPEAVFQVDQSWLDDQATTRGDDLNFPGVIVRDKVTLAARGL